jgi:NADPH-dependent glutamate synthase beta subunit-like oxidoreductase
LGKSIDKEFFNNEISKQFDTLVLAVGDAEKHELEALGFDNQAATPIANAETFETSQPGIFACGSILRKQKMAVKALAQGKAAARSVNQFLMGDKPKKATKKFNSKFGILKPEEQQEYLKEASEDKRLAPEQGLLDGFSSEEARLEAKRCMHCDCRKPVSCKLRQYADEYQIDRRTYLSGERKSIKKELNRLKSACQ